MEPPFRPMYSMSKVELKALRENLDLNLGKGFIRESTSLASALVLYIPKLGRGLRLIVDYQKLNEMIIKDRYALPLAIELRDRLQGAKRFTKLDLHGTFNLIWIKVGDEWKIAFQIRYGHYEYIVMPFGLTNAPTTCMRLMNNVL